MQPALNLKNLFSATTPVRWRKKRFVHWFNIEGILRQNWRHGKWPM